jgi:hypothetical protein
MQHNIEECFVKYNHENERFNSFFFIEKENIFQQGTFLL